MSQRVRKSAVEARLPLAPVVFEILLALADGERHGYAIKRGVLERTEGRVRLGAGTLYGAIKRMLEQGLIEESGNRPDSHLDDERRKYYKLTSFGCAVAKAEIARMEALIRQSTQTALLKPGKA